jgi:hypothetical protein
LEQKKAVAVVWNKIILKILQASKFEASMRTNSYLSEMWTCDGEQNQKAENQAVPKTNKKILPTL